MRKISLLLIIVLNLSCSSGETSKDDVMEMRRENDSLKAVLEKYKDKYVYDFVAVRQVPSIGNSFKKGSTYKGEITFVPANKEDYFLFGTRVKTTATGTEIIDPDTLRPSRGVYSFETELLSDTTKLYFKPLIQNILALEHKNSFYNELSFTDIILTE